MILVSKERIMKNSSSHPETAIHPAGKRPKPVSKDDPAYDEHHYENRRDPLNAPKEQENGVPKEEGE